MYQVLVQAELGMLLTYEEKKRRANYWVIIELDSPYLLKSKILTERVMTFIASS